MIYFCVLCIVVFLELVYIHESRYRLKHYENTGRQILHSHLHTYILISTFFSVYFYFCFVCKDSCDFIPSGVILFRAVQCVLCSSLLLLALGFCCYLQVGRFVQLSVGYILQFLLLSCMHGTFLLIFW